MFCLKKKPERSGRVTCTILTLTTHTGLDPTSFLYLLPIISFSVTPNASMQYKRKAQRQHRFRFILHYTGSPKQTTKISSFFFFLNGRGFNGGHRPSGKARAETLNIHGCRRCVAWALLHPERRRSWAREGFPLPDLHADYKRCLPHSMWSQLLLHVHHHSPP